MTYFFKNHVYFMSAFATFPSQAMPYDFYSVPLPAKRSVFLKFHMTVKYCNELSPSLSFFFSLPHSVALPLCLSRVRLLICTHLHLGRSERGQPNVNVTHNLLGLIVCCWVSCVCVWRVLVWEEGAVKKSQSTTGHLRNGQRV